MSIFTMIFAIVLIATLGSMWQQYLKHRRDIEKLNKRLDDAQGQETAKKVKELEDRIRVLERIATDPSERLKRDIDDLETT